jgi:hypothetical protein
MSDDFEDSSPWQHSMGSRVATLEVASDRHATRIGDHGGLLTAMDKDVSDAQAAFRAQLAVLNAVRETQSEHITVLREHTATLHEHTATLHDHTARLTEVHAGIQTIIGMLKSADDDKPGSNSPN